MLSFFWYSSLLLYFEIVCLGFLKIISSALCRIVIALMSFSWQSCFGQRSFDSYYLQGFAILQWSMIFCFDLFILIYACVRLTRRWWGVDIWGANLLDLKIWKALADVIRYISIFAVSHVEYLIIRVSSSPSTSMKSIVCVVVTILKCINVLVNTLQSHRRVSFLDKDRATRLWCSHFSGWST